MWNNGRRVSMVGPDEYNNYRARSVDNVPIVSEECTVQGTEKTSEDTYQQCLWSRRLLIGRAQNF